MASDPNSGISYTTTTASSTSPLDSLTTLNTINPYDASWASANIYVPIPSSGSLSGSVVTTTGGSSLPNWGTNTITTGTFISGMETERDTVIDLHGEEPMIATDKHEIKVNEIAEVIEIVKNIIDKDQIQIFDRAFRDKHEILQKAWEDIKVAYENYRITEAILRSKGQEAQTDGATP